MPYYGRVVDAATARLAKKHLVMPLGSYGSMKLYLEGSKNCALTKSDVSVCWAIPAVPQRKEGKKGKQKPMVATHYLEFRPFK
eukprot:8287209-Alexandrium_andersonii.AAC.1